MEEYLALPVPRFLVGPRGGCFREPSSLVDVGGVEHVAEADGRDQGRVPTVEFACSRSIAPFHKHDAWNGWHL